MNAQQEVNVDARARPRPAPPPPGGDADSSDRRRNRHAVAGLVLSLIAIVPPSWLIYEFTTNYDEWFEGSGLFFDDAFTLLFTLLVFLPVELVLLCPSFVFSFIGHARARRGGQPRDPRAIAGIAVSVVAAIMVVGIVATTVAIL